MQYLSRTAGTIALGETDFYQFYFTAGDLVTINADSLSTLDAKVALLNAATGTLAAEDGTSEGLNHTAISDSPLYAFQIPSTGVYYVSVQAPPQVHQRVHTI